MTEFDVLEIGLSQGGIGLYVAILAAGVLAGALFSIGFVFFSVGDTPEKRASAAHAATIFGLMACVGCALYVPAYIFDHFSIWRPSTVPAAVFALPILGFGLLIGTATAEAARQSWVKAVAFIVAVTFAVFGTYLVGERRGSRAAPPGEHVAWRTAAEPPGEGVAGRPASASATPTPAPSPSPPQHVGLKVAVAPGVTLAGASGDLGLEEMPGADPAFRVYRLRGVPVRMFVPPGWTVEENKGPRTFGGLYAHPAGDTAQSLEYLVHDVPCDTAVQWHEPAWTEQPVRRTTVGDVELFEVESGALHRLLRITTTRIESGRCYLMEATAQAPAAPAWAVVKDALDRSGLNR